MGVSIGVAAVFTVGRANRSVHLNNDGSPLQTENDRACSNENNSKPLPSGSQYISNIPNNLQSYFLI
jgi:hypothetical protein